MDNVTAANNLLDKICSIDNKLKGVMTDDATKSHVLNDLSQRFDSITKEFPHLVEDIQNRIVKYHSAEGDHKKITDFVQLVDWYGMSLASKPVEYWDTNGKYFGLRMSEVINMFLIARFNC
jgi:hypothetical protein